MVRTQILVIEDENIVALDLKNRLEILGYTVPAVISSGQEAIHQAAEIRPDLILMDIKLKGSMDGIAAAGQIRDRFDIPLIYLTAYADEVTLERAKITEPFGYLLKPFEDRELQTTIEIALYKHRMERRLKESEQWLSAILTSVDQAVIATDIQGCIKFMNPVAETLTGWSQTEALGSDLSELFKLIDLETRTPLENPITRVTGGEAEAEALLVARDGQERPVESSLAPLRDDQGAITGTVLVFRDISERKQAEKQLRQSEERFRSIFENAVMGLYRSTPAGRILMANPALVRMLGYSSFEELAQRNLEENGFVPDYPRSAFKERIESEGQVIGQESAWLKRDGHKLFVRESARAIRDETGHTLYYEGTVEDISQRKQTEEEIGRRNQELTLLNQIIAASVTSLEPAEILATACQELASAFAVARLTATLVNAEKTEAAVVAEYLVEDRSSALNTCVSVAGDPVLQYLLIHKAPLVIDKVQPEGQDDPHLSAIHQVMRQRGAAALLILPLIVAGEVVGSLALEAGQPRHFSAAEINLAWSVTDQVAMTLARAWLDKERRQLSAAIEQTAESVFITDTEGTILYVNPAFERTTGYRRAEAVGRTPRLLKSGQQDADFYRAMWTTTSHGGVWQGRFINKKKDGTLYTAEETITPIQDEAGFIVNYVAVKRDVTYQLQLEEQYHQAQKMEAVGRLTAGIAHDFNNSLTVINGFAQLMQFTLPPDAPQRESVNNILEAGRRAANLVSQLLAFSRKQIIEPKVVELNTLVAEMDKMLRRIIGEDIKLKTDLAPDLWPVKIDPTQVDQVIFNLAVNARDAMPAGGRLTIETTNVTLNQAYVHQHAEVTPGHYVMLAISDNGIGMNEEVKQHIFEPFFTTKEVGQGTGLGLATVFGIVKQNGGHIWVYSEPDQGTTFKIYLPRLVEAELPAHSSEQANHLPQGTETILLVEDEPTVRELASRVLRQQGYTVLEAANGQEALLLAREHRGEIHLLLTDVIMPGMNGKALAGRLASIYPQAKVLFVSGYPDSAMIHHGMLDPGVMFIQKPFSPAALVRKIREVLDDSSR